MTCEVRVRRAIRCGHPARSVPDLGMRLCGKHEENERKLRRIGLDSRADNTKAELRAEVIQRGWGPITVVRGGDHGDV